MKNWFIMLGIDILIPLLMLILGWLLAHKTPRKNAIYGCKQVLWKVMDKVWVNFIVYFSYSNVNCNKGK